MKTLGIIGGMSWESNQTYYSLINQGVKERLGGLHSAKILLYSVDFAQVEVLQASGDWGTAAKQLCSIAQGLEAGGAEAILIATNTMHKLAEQVQSAITVPLLHIADAAGEQLRLDGRKKVALLGTKFTMEEAFYTDKLVNDYGLDVIVPSQAQREIVHKVIYDELCLGQIRQTSRVAYCEIIDDLVHQGADSIVLGCTEIPLLITADDSSAPLYDTTALHAQAAIEFMLSET